MSNKIESRLKEILDKIANDNGYKIITINGDLDHIHLLIECTPQHYIPDIIKALKGVSARLLMKEYGDELKKKLWGGHLWNPSYFIATTGNVSIDILKEYVETQRNKKIDEN